MSLIFVAAMIYLTHTLDRANLGNAKSGTLEKDLGLVGNQYSLVLMLFYIPYAIFGIPDTILAKRFNPGLVIPLLVLGWDALAMATSAVKDFRALMATRIVLGLMEAGSLPCSTYYASMFYTRKELALRLSVFFCMGFIAVRCSMVLMLSQAIFLTCSRARLAVSSLGASFNGIVL
jgi:Sugar phosphate permease